jgi:hypothetical protein
MNKVRVDQEQCRVIGKVMKGFTIRQSSLEREFITFESDPETKLRAYLYVVGICQQTQILAHKKLNLYGFNYLEKVFVDLGKAHSELLEPTFLAQQSSSDLSLRLGILFSETGLSKDATLDRLGERSGQLIDMGQKLVERHAGRMTDLIEKSGGFLSGTGGLYALLNEFEAYSDPLKKKSSLFVKFAMEAGLIEVKDLDVLVPIIDYHVQRVLMRFGCVEIIDPDLKKALINRDQVSSDVEIREASLQALRYLAEESGHTGMAVHDFLWPLGRSCCLEKPLCQSGSCDKKPCTFNLFVNLDSRDYSLA